MIPWPGMRALAVAAVIAAVARAAAAQPTPTPAPLPQPPPDEAEAIAQQGEDLARQGEFSRAIDAFKQADAITPRARYACLVGLVYTRRELWSQAELFFARCHDRATAADPVPDWLAEAERQLTAKLAEVDAAAVDLRVEPADAGATLRIASFPADESFAPRVIHLAAGTHVVTATADGYEAATQNVEVTGREPMTVTLQLHRPGEIVDTRPQLPPRKRKNVAKYLWIGAGGAAGIGVVFHLLASRERTQLSTAHDQNNTTLYDKHSSRFDTFRAVTFACYGAAFTAAGIGLVLYLTRDKDDEGPRVGGWLDAGGGGFSLEWDR